MKNNKQKIITLMMVIVLCVSVFIDANAEDIYLEKYKSFGYTKDYDDEVSIYKYNGKKSKVTIPAKIKGKKVSTVSLIKAKNLKSIKLSRYVKIVYLAEIRTLKKSKSR